MRVQYRIHDDPGKIHVVKVTSPNTTIQQIRGLFADGLCVTPERLRLIFGGKQLDDSYTLFHCNIRDSDTILVIVKGPIQVSSLSEQNALEGTSGVPSSSSSLTLDGSSVTARPLENYIEPSQEVADKKTEFYCTGCQNNSRRRCKNCGCAVCGGKGDEDRTLVCDECDLYYHMDCLKPKIKEVPSDDWYCPTCCNDPSVVVGPGQNAVVSAKKSKMPSAATNKDWGRGRACASLSKTCTVVGPDHIGPIPGVPVGSSWRFRINVSESGVHRPPVAGIAGRTATGAVSVVLAAGYADDVDNGLEFTYTGAGGRNLKEGNKRVGEQTCDQELKGVNEALAITCDCAFDRRGGRAKDWRKSRPVRVIRSAKLAAHNPKFAPKQGNRYDGIYKLVKYWPQKGVSGLLVWRFLMRRDDPEPAPWTPEGIRRIRELGLVMYDPDAEKGAPSDRAYIIPPAVVTLMKADTDNVRSWSVVQQSTLSSYADLLSKVFEDVFACPICKEKVESPVTTSCTHNACWTCLQDAFRNNGKVCPTCRADLSRDKIKVNSALESVFERLMDPVGFDQKQHTKNNVLNPKRTHKAILTASAKKRVSGSTAATPTKRTRFPSADTTAKKKTRNE